MTAFLKVKNEAYSTLLTGISDVALSLAVTSGHGARFPSTYPFHITIDEEILECTSRSTDVLTVTREAESTTATAHVAGALVALNITEEVIQQLQDHEAILDAHFEVFTAETPVGKYLPPMPVSDAASFPLTANRLYVTACRVPRDMTFDYLAIDVETIAAGKVARLGIYDMGSNGKPSDLVVDAGEVSVATLGFKTVAITDSLTKGWYYMAIVSDGTPSIRGGRAAYSILGMITANWNAPTLAGYYKTHAYGALPDPFGVDGETESGGVYFVNPRIASLD